MNYPVIIIQDKETDGFFIQSYDIPEGIAQGDTKEEAKNDLLSVFEDILELNHFEQNRPVPLPSKTEDILIENIEECCGITLDGEAKDYLDYVELPEDMSQKIMTHNATLTNI
jgi:predicted RNase H-like HicB family nuclease